MKILLVSLTQMGYLTDYHRYYEYLKSNGHDVRFICWDFGKKRLHDNPYHVMYVSREGSKMQRTNRLIKTVVDLDKNWNFDRIMVNWFPLCTRLLKYIPNEKLYMDVRTVNVHPQPWKKRFYDYLVKLSAKRFQNVSVISHGSAKQIGIERYRLLPLGGAKFITPNDNSGTFNFLYVGTLHLRKIIDCVKGFHQFLINHPLVDARFIIVGDAIHHELNEINEYIASNNLKSRIITTGYVPQEQLKKYMEMADFGVCYIPLTKAFTVQPATKTYEYLVNGIPVIATRVTDNVRVIETSHTPVGVLIDDTPEGFEKGLEEILANHKKFHRTRIAREFAGYTWEKILSEYLHNVLNLPNYTVGAVPERSTVVKEPLKKPA